MFKVGFKFGLGMIAAKVAVLVTCKIIERIAEEGNEAIDKRTEELMDEIMELEVMEKQLKDDE